MAVRPPSSFELDHPSELAPADMREMAERLKGKAPPVDVKRAPITMKAEPPPVPSYKPKPSNINPLSGYYRTPGTYITPPSGGHYNHEQDMQLTASNELEIFPMTAADELILKNPDSLLNGHAVEKVIQSCVPGVKNVRGLINQDIEAILLAIKYASFGDNMPLSSTCPSCGTINESTLSISYLLETSQPLPNEFVFRYDDRMVFYLRPHTFESHTKASLAQYEETKILRSIIGETDISETDKLQEIQTSFDRIAHFNLELLSYCIMAIAVPEGVVDDQRLIQEFIINADRRLVKQLQDEIQKVNTFGGVQKRAELECVKCNHVWETDIVYDPASFFE